VAYVKPVGRSTRPNDEIPVDVSSSIFAPQALDLNYGYSASQLSQIRVPEVHAEGYDGEGVTLAIFDTGFRKTHDAFALHYAEGRVLGEWDFIFDDGNTANEPEDASNQWNHGTYIWSVCGGYADGVMYGPAYKANFLLCKTEDVRSETVVEEDNWVAALEWVDVRGADVVTSSLAYIDWYSYEDMDGATAITTLAANTAAGLGIVVCNAMANSGPLPGTLHAPADAFDMLAVGSVDSRGIIAYSSSRGPTYDGRTKPEVCARGVLTYCATAYGDEIYGTANGTSLATPLVAGAACLLIHANPDYTPQMIRLSLMETACNATTPDNNYGWGILKTDLAMNTWPATFITNRQVAESPFNVQFTHTATIDAISYTWSFGDGDSSHTQNPTHRYTEPGAYDVSLKVEFDTKSVTNEQAYFILAIADTLIIDSVTACAGQTVAVPINLTNTAPLNQIEIPFIFDGDLNVKFDSITFAERTSHFESIVTRFYDMWNSRFVFRLIADDGGGALPLEPGSGAVANIWGTIDSTEPAGLTTVVDIMSDTSAVILTSINATYEAQFVPGLITSISPVRGDVDANGRIDIDDAIFIINYIINAGPAPTPEELANLNDDDVCDIDDIIYLVEYMFQGGPPPPPL
jgi:PKD repeat protein